MGNVSDNIYRMRVTIYTDRYKFMIISGLVPLGMGNVSDNYCRMKGTLYTDRYTFTIVFRSVLVEWEMFQIIFIE